MNNSLDSRTRDAEVARNAAEAFAFGGTFACLSDLPIRKFWCPAEKRHKTRIAIGDCPCDGVKPAIQESSQTLVTDSFVMQDLEFSDLGIGQALGSAAPSSAIFEINHVVPMIAEIQVGRVAATANVAAMQDPLAFWDWPVCQFPREAMGVMVMAGDAVNAVASAGGSLPDPTRAEFACDGWSVLIETVPQAIRCIPYAGGIGMPSGAVQLLPRLQGGAACDAKALVHTAIVTGGK